MILKPNLPFECHFIFVSTTCSTRNAAYSKEEKRRKKQKKTENKANVCFFSSLPGAHTLYAILQSLHSVIYLSPLNWNFHVVLAIKLSLFAARSLLMILLSPSLLGFVRSVLSRREKWTLNRRPAFTALGLFRPAVAMQQCEMLAQHDLDRVQQ